MAGWGGVYVLTDLSLDQETRRHVPVMCSQVLDMLQPRDGGIYIDATFGAGGYSRAILGAANCAVIGIDRDPDAIEGAKQLIEEFPGRLHMCLGRFFPNGSAGGRSCGR